MTNIDLKYEIKHCVGIIQNTIKLCLFSIKFKLSLHLQFCDSAETFQCSLKGV